MFKPRKVEQNTWNHQNDGFQDVTLLERSQWKTPELLLMKPTESGSSLGHLESCVANMVLPMVRHRPQW